MLIERESDQERHRVLGDQRVGLVGVSEVQAVGHCVIVALGPQRSGREAGICAASANNWSPTFAISG
jgi:hypothetical protein